MYPMVEARLSVATNLNGEAIYCMGSLSRERKSENHEVQKQKAELQANAETGQEAASQTTTSGALSQTRNIVGKGLVSLAGEDSGLSRFYACFPALRIAATRSLIHRVPLARVTSIVFVPTACSLITRAFRWRDGVKELEFQETCLSQQLGVGKDAVASGLHFNTALEHVSVPWPLGLQELRLSSNWNLRLHGAHKNWSTSLEKLAFPPNFNQPMTGDGVGLPLGLREIEPGRFLISP